MKARDKSTIGKAASLQTRNTSKQAVNTPDIPGQSQKISTNDSFAILLRGLLILGLLAILFVAAIYYGIINP
ncbi:hypothetical protein CLI64_08585 [Nostoc sp. CENA543]|uniref:hypothetical protein n=1 Tax=Nostoc sp. CENA543 TaxID=1869241 RepID=UPI000CA1B84B|nr:hypothetical protein [Nostoc sp. CENA543]AUT00440.1 hypothetical protein CLI64_08585 [Nostoc sp. CENA543]